MGGSFLSHALDWAARGFRVFPLRPGTKLPVIKGWQDKATSDAEIIRKVWAAKDYNIGVLTTGMIVVDVDVKDGAAGEFSYDEVLGLPRDTLCVKTPSGGAHFYFMGPDVANSAGTVAGGIDVRSRNGFVVAPGSVLTGVEAPYTLVNDVPLLDCPETFLVRLERPRERQKVEAQIEEDTALALQEATAYLARAPRAIEGAGGDNQTYTVACQMRDYGVSQHTAFEMMEEHWNEDCSPPWDAEALYRKVENAYQYASNAQGSALPTEDFKGLVIEAPVYRQRAPSKFMWAGDKVNLSNLWLLRNKLPSVGSAMLVSPTQGGKTFFVLTLAECLAQGLPFFGVTAKAPCATFILTGEAPASMAKRLMGCPKGLPIASSYLRGTTVKGKVDAMIAAVEEFKADPRVDGMRLGLVVMDTLASLGLTENENDNAEMARLMNYMEDFAARFACLVLFTHHTPKATGGPRGASSIISGVSVAVEIVCEGNNPVHNVQALKNRDGKRETWGSFTLEDVVLGVDEEGETVTTARLSMSDRAAATPKSPPKHMESFMRSFEAARFSEQLGKGAWVPKEALRHAFVDQSALSAKTASTPFNRCLAWAESAFEVSTDYRDGATFILDQRPAIGDSE